MASKVCTKCAEEKPLDQFSCNKNHPGGHEYQCKECAAKEQVERRTKKKLELLKYKGNKCSDCGFDDVQRLEVFEFHHRDPREKDFALGRDLNRSMRYLKKEADKCVLLCANCHRTAHRIMIEEQNGGL